MGMRRPRRPGPSQLRLGLRLVGAGLLIAAGAVHLDLHLTGYRSIPVIGWLFLFQVIAAFVLAAVVLASGSRLAAAGAGFAVATLGGYLLSVWISLFGFKEVRTTAGIVRKLSPGIRTKVSSIYRDPQSLAYLPIRPNCNQGQMMAGCQTMKRLLKPGGAPGGRTLNQRFISSLLRCPGLPSWANVP
jgi:hypothetical protein